MYIESDLGEQEDFTLYNGEGTNLRKAQMRLLDILLEFDRICKKHNIHYFLSGGTCLGAVRHGGFIPWDDDIDIDVWHTDYNKLVDILPKELNNKFVMQTEGTDSAFSRGYMRIVDTESEVGYEDNTIRNHFVHKGLWLDILPLEKCFSYRMKGLVDYFYSGSKSNLAVPKKPIWKHYSSYLIYPLAALSVKGMNFLSRYFTEDEKISHAYGTAMAPRLLKSNCFPVSTISFEGYKFYAPANTHKYLSGLYGENYLKIPSKKNRQFHAQTIKFFDE